MGMGTVLVLRLGFWQIVKASDLDLAAKSQRLISQKIESLRGEIKSQDGFAWATNLSKYRLAIDSRYFPKDRNKLGHLENILGSTASGEMFTRLANPKNIWLPIDQDIDELRKKEIDDLKISGITWENVSKRWYPEASLSAYLTGFVGRDNEGNPQGYFGLEGFYNRDLLGRAGKIIGEKDGLNRPILIDGQEYIPDQPGSSLQTSIDRTLQYLAYQKLKTGLGKYQAVSGNVIIMEPATGRILTMVSLPDYDPNKYQTYNENMYRNPAVADTYEPGSTFKVITMAAAIDAGVVKEDTRCTICQGPITIGDAVVKTWNDRYYPNSTMTEVIQHSDNTGMVFVGRSLGRDRLLDYLDKFGFGHLTGIDLQEEAQATLRPKKDWYEIDVAAGTFGQGIAVTPLQMVRAVGAIANQGRIVTPLVVDKIGDKPVSRPRPVSIISPVSAAIVTKMMVNSVNNGEAKWAKPAGFTVAGKTGTAQIPVSGHYDKTKTIASFVGFAPIDQPRFVMLVTLREPKTSPWGSETAAPLWFEIAREIFRYYGIFPS